MKVKSESEVAQSAWLLVTPWTAAHQAPPSMGFSRQKYCSGVPLPYPEYIHNYFIKINLYKWYHSVQQITKAFNKYIPITIAPWLCNTLFLRWLYFSASRILSLTAWPALAIGMWADITSHQSFKCTCVDWLAALDILPFYNFTMRISFPGYLLVAEWRTRGSILNSIHSPNQSHPSWCSDVGMKKIFVGDQPWDFFGRNDAKAETPVLWPPHLKSWLIGKDSDAGRVWGQEEKGTTEDEMAGWHHWLDGHEFEWTLGDGDGQGGLMG